MTRSLNRAARWHAQGGSLEGCSLRRLTLEQFEYHDLVVNGYIPVDRLPVGEAFEVRDDRKDEIVGVVWKTPRRVPADPRATRNWRWQYIDCCYQIGVGPTGLTTFRSHWWSRDRAVGGLIASEQDRRERLIGSSQHAAALDDFYI